LQIKSIGNRRKLVDGTDPETRFGVFEVMLLKERIGELEEAIKDARNELAKLEEEMKDARLQLSVATKVKASEYY